MLTIETASLKHEPVFEDLYGSGMEFPHVYGPLELSAVTDITPLPCDEDGRFDWWKP